MHFPRSTLLSTLALLTSSALATPVNQQRSSIASGDFYLQTSLAGNATDTSKAGLYVYGYHTGAGLADACLATEVNGAATAFYNSDNSSIQFDYGGDYAWGMVLDSDINYGIWESIFVDAGAYGTSGLIIEPDNTVTWNSTEFANWLACDWYHGVPQLFYQNAYYSGFVPASCSAVTLTAVPI